MVFAKVEDPMVKFVNVYRNPLVIITPVGNKLCLHFSKYANAYENYPFSFLYFNRMELPTTTTSLNAIDSAATMGFNNPAMAMGIATRL